MTALDPEDLLAEHSLYDQYVDVVSAFEWLYTETQDMPGTVSHFERFPKVTAGDGNAATPDFAVLFTDGTGLVGEIARIALHENSVESLCRQIARYDTLTALPSSDGNPVAVSHTDVLLIVPFELGTDVIRRVITERLEDDAHTYKPGHPPCIVQYVAQPDKYVFQRRADAGNGTLRETDREPALGKWLQRSEFKPPAEHFATVKARRPFMNDPVAPLYLACQLWTKLFPTLTTGVAQVGDYKPLIIDLTCLARELQSLYGPVERTAIRGAMAILVASRCAEELGADRWRVAWGDLAHAGGDDVSEVLARRTTRPPAKGPIRRLIEAYSDQGVPDPVHTPPPEPGQLFTPAGQ